MSSVMEKCALLKMCVVIPKEGFVYDTDCKIALCCLYRLYYVIGVIPREGLARPCLSVLLLI